MENQITQELIINTNDVVLNNVIITKHAYERAKERLRWKHKVLDKMAEKAYLDGIKHKDTKGSLMKYLTKLWFKYKHCNNVRIYGENIYFFSDNVLITIYQLPNTFKKYLKISTNNLNK